jgi:hypothetical protein
MNRDHRGRNQADGVLGQWPHHFLAALAANQAGFALLVSHWENPLGQSLDQARNVVKATPASERIR